MISPDELRERFKKFTGVGTFAKFIRVLHQNPEASTRLRFWQHDLWESFLSSNPDCVMTTEDLRSILRLCELHESELAPIDVPVFRGCIDYAPDYIEERKSSFPHARLDKVMVDDNDERTEATIWVCAECDDILNRSRWR